MSFDKLGKYTEAIRYYRNFLELKSFSEDAVFAKERLKELRDKRILHKNNSLKIV